MRTFSIAIVLLMLTAVPIFAQKSRTSGPAPGTIAPDFTLFEYNPFAGKQQKRKNVTLSKIAAQKPVVLIFGSYT